MVGYVLDQKHIKQISKGYQTLTGYKDHFPWVVKPWNIEGKFVKTQCFTSLYQLWENQNIPNFLQL
jgi:hypothetical protein